MKLRPHHLLLIAGICGLGAGLQASPSTSEFPFDPPGPSASETDSARLDALADKARTAGFVPVIIKFRGDFVPEGKLLGAAKAIRQRARISSAQNSVLKRLPSHDPKSVKRYRYVPYLAMRVDAVSLDVLQSSPEVEQIVEDQILRPTLPQSVPLIGADKAWAAGYSGAAQAVAILDTGVDKTHPFLAGKVIQEACFSTTLSVPGLTSRTLCPNGQDVMEGPGAGVACALSECAHGTQVAGIAVGRGATFSGVARDASVIAAQVFSWIQEPGRSYLGAWTSDLMGALEFVYRKRTSTRTAAVNLSLGGGAYGANCDSHPLKAGIDTLRAIGVATVVAAGNDGFTTALAAPACISSAVSVGATDKSDRVAAFSNSAGFLSLLAPGVSIYSSVPRNGFTSLTGTSMAAPHVAGAWAVLKSKRPDAGVAQILAVLTNTGRWVQDSRNSLWKRRVQVDAAVQALWSYALETDLVADFGPGGGSYSWINGKGWAGILHPSSAQSITATEFNLDGSPDLVVDFGSGSGIWTWLSGKGFSERIHTLSARHVTAADFDADGRSDLAVDFGARAGIWTWSYDKGWTGQLHASTAVHVVAIDLNGDKRSDLAIDFGPGSGIWTWISGVGFTGRLHPASARHIVAIDFNQDGLSDLAVDFGPGSGIWSWVNGRGFTGRMHPFNARHVVATDLSSDGKSDLVIDFGPGYGIWLWVNGQGYVNQLHTASATHIAPIDFNRDGKMDLAIDFGAGYGIWSWVNGAGYTARINPQTSRHLVPGAILGH